MTIKKFFFDHLPGAAPMDQQKWEDFYRAMKDEAVPEVVEAIRERQLLAAESRLWTSTRPPWADEDN